MPSRLLTARFCQGVSAPQKGQIEYFDQRVPGMALRVTSKGVKSWTLVYRHEGRVRRWTIGRFPDLSLADAREKAADARRTIAHGGDPGREKQMRRHAPTVAEMAEQYLTMYAKVHKRSWRQDERTLTVEIFPHWSNRLAGSITRGDVYDLLDGIMLRGTPVAANRTLALVRKLYNWGISRDLVQYNPCQQIKPPGQEHARDRVLTTDEIIKVWRACEQVRSRAVAILEIQLLTAQRSGEVKTMRWEDIDGAWWTIPSSVSKNKQSHRVPLSQPVLAILYGLKAKTGRMAYAFPGRNDPRRPMIDASGVLKRVRDLSGVDFRPHDLRRTAASHMTGMGISRLVVSKILNHSEPGVTAVYDRHSYDIEKQDALTRWADKVQAMVSGELGRVIPLRG